VSTKEIAEIEFPYPPLPEQQRIVGKLDAAFAALTEAQAHVERNRANARELFESYLNGVFEGKDGWTEKTLGDLGKVSMCKRILKQQTSPTGDIPFYKIGTFGKVPDAFIPQEIYEDFKRKYQYPKKGDVLISASGTIGRGVVFDGEPAYFQDSNIVWIENDESQVLNEYLFQFYKVCDWNPSKGATISRLYNDDLRRIKISFPSLKEQRRLVDHMVQLDEETRQLETTYQQKLSELAGLKKAVLGAAFRGEL
jgi:type I restriction enzyme S subunit